MNEVILTGIIESYWTDGQTSHIRVFSRQSGSGADVEPEILYYGKLPRFVKKRERVRITGFLQKHVGKNDKGGWIVSQRIVATKILKRKTQCEEIFGVPGSYFEPPMISILLKGVVKKVFTEKGWVRIQIKTDGQEEETDLTLHMHLDEIKERQKIPAVNDTICCVCTLSTRNKKNGDKNIILEDIMVSDLAIQQK